MQIKKKHIWIGAIACITLFGFKQTNEAAPETIKRTINVTGSAEISVIPDSYDLTIHFKNGVKNKTKFVSTEEKIKRAARKVGIPDSCIVIKAGAITKRGYYWSYYWRHNRERELEKNLIFRLSDVKQMDTLFKQISKDVDQSKIENIYVGNFQNSDIQKFRKKVKTTAAKAAKEKAQNMLTAIGAKIGKPITITELKSDGGFSGQNYWWRQNKLSSNVYSNAVLPTHTSKKTASTESFENIKLRYEVNAVFEIH